MRRNILLVALMLCLMTTAVFAETPISVIVNGEAIEFTNETGVPFVDNGNTLVPFRVIIEKIGAEVEWNGETKTVIAKKGDITVEAPIGESYILRNGKSIEISASAVAKEGRTYIPIRAVVEALGGDVGWDNDTKAVIITTISEEEAAEAKAAVLEAMEKQLKWENYNAYAEMNISMGGFMNMDMEMEMTMFKEPMKLKAKIDAAVEVLGESEEVEMEMYGELKDGKYVVYMQVPTQDGGIEWQKMTTEMDGLMDPEAQAEIEKLNMDSIKSAKLLSKDEGVSAYEVTITFEGFNEVFGTVMNSIQAAPGQNEMMAAMFENMEDMTTIIVIDDATGEVIGQSINMSEMMESMFDGIEELGELFKDIHVMMTMKFTDVNKATAIEIPTEALNATEMKVQ